MEREKIGIDVDEVLLPFAREFINYDRQRYPSDLRIEDFFCYRFEDVINISLEEAKQRVYDFNGADHSLIAPIEGAQEGLERLGDKHDLVVVTARHPQFASNTRSWLDIYLEDYFADIVHIGYAPLMEHPKRKVDICRDLGLIALIDDSVDHVTECAEEGIEGILFGDYPWNQVDELPSGVTRCANWAAVLEHFDGRG
jgi:uncharacterized HAD superfamily protein